MPCLTFQGFDAFGFKGIGHGLKSLVMVKGEFSDDGEEGGANGETENGGKMGSSAR